MSDSICDVEDCKNLVHRRVWCSKHYQRYMRHGDPLGGGPSPVLGRTGCKSDGCTQQHYAHGLCHKHYQRHQKYGNHEAGNARHSDPVDALKYRTKRKGSCLVWTGSINQKGYGRINIDGRLVTAHRYAWYLEFGAIPDGSQINHICWEKSCVNTDHLELASSYENASYRKGANSNSTSGIRNVSRKGGRWHVSITKDRKTHNFGTYEDIEEAAQVAEQARKDLFGEFAGKG